MKASEIKDLEAGTRVFRRIKNTGEVIECEIIDGVSTKMLRDVKTGRKWPIWDYRHMVLEV